MPVLPTYPGVYIEELPSGVRTITGVATSITAFIGRASRGELNKATVINSFADYERLFGGVSAKSMMSYAVKDFYLNGGSQAVIVRISKTGKTAEYSVATNGTAIGLKASSEGVWGDNLQITIDHNTKDSTNKKLFNITITEIGGATETFRNVSTVPDDARYLPRVLDQGSLLAKVGTMSDNSEPTDTAANTPIVVTAGKKGDDGVDVTATEYKGTENTNTGLWALKKSEFNLLCIPPATRGGDTASDVYSQALTLCVNHRAMLLVDSPNAWGESPTPASEAKSKLTTDLSLSGDAARNAALFFPRVKQIDPLRDGQIETMVPCGIVAGIMSRTDTSRGVWKSPAGIDAALNGVQGLQTNLSDAENGMLNPLGINCLRSFPVTGRVVWGARTMRGADQFADDYKYIAVRRTALFIEESLYRGSQWVVFEPNDEPLWAQIRLNVGAFMHNLFRQGAFQGKTPKEAYLVKCDKETTTQNDINSGIVNILVGFAPLKPAEFVIIKIQQLAGQVES
ncbi:MAG TPA: phage tail sheath C-terminal domain-containing protein [Flavipsychrobacter sp.]|nr:phage tail sheath C-terminal domain-containing protein [Flavipsychrobacter sp.]